MVSGLWSKRPPLSGSTLADYDFFSLKAEFNVVLINLLLHVEREKKKKTERSSLIMANFSTKLKAEVNKAGGRSGDRWHLINALKC